MNIKSLVQHFNPPSEEEFAHVYNRKEDSLVTINGKMVEQIHIHYAIMDFDDPNRATRMVGLSCGGKEYEYNTLIHTDNLTGTYFPVHAI